MPIGELWSLDPLAAACAADGRWSFLLTVAPLSVVGAMGSPANAIPLRSGPDITRAPLIDAATSIEVHAKTLAARECAVGKRRLTCPR